MTDYTAQADTIRAEMQRQGDAIAQDRDLTAAARSQRLDAIWTDGTARLEALYSQHQQDQASTRERTHKAAFTPPSTDPGRMASLRDAMDRAKTASESEHGADALRAMLDTAEMMGDEDQAYAVFVAAERGMHLEVVERYVQDRPDAARRYAEYRDARREDLTRTITEGMAFTAPARPVIGEAGSWFG